jgi:hypothetical protein
MLEPWIISPQVALDRPNNRLFFYTFDQKVVEDIIGKWSYVIDHPKGEFNSLLAAVFDNESHFNSAAIALKLHYGPLNERAK